MRCSSLSRHAGRFQSFAKVVILLVSILLISLTCLPAKAYCAQVTLAWDPSTGTGLAGYKVYHGVSSRQYGPPADAGSQTTCRISELQEGTTYYFAATAYDVDGNESDYSEEISYRVPATNTAPVAQNGAIGVTEDVRSSGSLRAGDSDNDSLTYRVVGPAGKGSVAIVDASTGAYTYTPNANAHGPDTFTFVASDGVLDSNTATVTVSITPVNDAPVAVNDTANTAADATVTINVLANDSDIDGGALSVASATQGAKGSVAVNSGKIDYSPRPDQSGDDTFTYTVSDGNGGAATARVDVTIIAAGNHPPVALSGAITARIGTRLKGKLRASDSDGDALTYSIVSPPAQGVLRITNPSTGAFSYKPGRRSRRGISFTFKANDGKTDSNVASMSVSTYRYAKVEIEAESGSLNLPMTVGEDNAASGGEYALVPAGAERTADAGVEGGYAEYAFEVPISGEYMIFARVRSDSLTQKAFHVSMDNGELIEWSTTLGGRESWVWDNVTDGSTSGPIFFPLDAGTHTLIVKQREAGAMLDKILITTQPDFLDEVVYEDAEDLTVGGWDVVDADPPGAGIVNVFDEDCRSNVIELTGSGTQNAYRLLSESFRPWGDRKRFVVEWSLKYSETFNVFVEVMTTAGKRTLAYLPRNNDSLGEGRVVRLGVGKRSTDGQWHRFTRDLQSDLNMAQPGVQITKVKSFTIRGNGRVDDIKLRTSY